MTDLETLVRAWASRRGIPLDPASPVPQQIIDRYRKARAYAIRKSYARRAAKSRTSISGRTPGAAYSSSAFAESDYLVVVAT